MAGWNNMPSLQHVFEKVHVHMACCGGTVTIREHGTDATDGGASERPGRWHTFKTLLRSWFSCRLWGGQQIGAQGPETGDSAGEDAPLVKIAIDLHPPPAGRASVPDESGLCPEH